MNFTPLEERRLAELKQYVAARAEANPLPARRGPRRYARPALALGAAAAAATAGLVATAVGGGTPAYAVTKDADGTVTITLDDFHDTAQLSAELKQLGVPAAVYFIPQGQYCYQAGVTPVADVPQGLYEPPSSPPSGQAWSMRLDPDLIQPGQLLLFGLSAGSAQSKVWDSSSTYLVSGQASACQTQSESSASAPGSFRFPGQTTPQWPSGMHTNRSASPRS